MRHPCTARLPLRALFSFLVSALLAPFASIATERGKQVFGVYQYDNIILNKPQAALIHFAQTPAGATYFTETRQMDFRPLDVATLQRIDPFTRVFDAP